MPTRISPRFSPIPVQIRPNKHGNLITRENESERKREGGQSEEKFGGGREKDGGGGDWSSARSKKARE